MKITVYGREDCPNCKTITNALQERQLDYQYRDIDRLEDMWSDTKDLELLAVRATLCISEEIPVVVAEGTPMSYEAALWAFDIKETKCKDGVCKL